MDPEYIDPMFENAGLNGGVGDLLPSDEFIIFGLHPVPMVDGTVAIVDENGNIVDYN